MTGTEPERRGRPPSPSRAGRRAEAAPDPHALDDRGTPSCFARLRGASSATRSSSTPTLRHARRARAPRRLAPRRRGREGATSTATTSRSSPASTGSRRRRRGRRGRRRHVVAGAAAGDDSAPPAPTAASRCSRTCSPRSRHWGITLKADVDERGAARRSRGCRSTPGADWHERECWEMYGFVLRRPPALAPPLPPVGVRGAPAAQGLPAARAGREAVARPRRRRADARGSDRRRRRRRGRRGEPTGAAAERGSSTSTTNPPLPEIRGRPARAPPPRRRAGQRRARHRRHDPQPRAAAPRDPRHAAPRRAPRRRARASPPTR